MEVEKTKAYHGVMDAMGLVSFCEVDEYPPLLMMKDAHDNQQRFAAYFFCDLTQPNADRVEELIALGLNVKAAFAIKARWTNLAVADNHELNMSVIPDPDLIAISEDGDYE